MNALRQNKAACAYPAMLLNGVCASSGGVVMALLQERYGLSYQWSGLLLAMLSVGNLAAGFAAGMLPAHWGQRHTVLMLAGGAALGYGAMIDQFGPVRPQLRRRRRHRRAAQGVPEGLRNHRAEARAGDAGVQVRPLPDHRLLP